MKFHENFFDAVSFTAMALMAFALTGFSDKSKRVMAPENISYPYYIASLPPEPQYLAPFYPPLTYQKPTQEAVILRKSGWRTLSDKEYHARWGYGPETDTLVVAGLEIQYPPPPPRIVNLGRNHHVALRG